MSTGFIIITTLIHGWILVSVEGSKPEHFVNFIASQQSYKVHKKLLTSYAAARDKYASILHIGLTWPVRIGDEQLRNFQSGKPVDAETTTDKLEPFIANEDRPEKYPGLMALPTYHFQAVAIYNLNTFKTALAPNNPGSIKISSPELAEIFLGKRKTWGDITLPGGKISDVVGTQFDLKKPITIVLIRGRRTMNTMLLNYLATTSNATEKDIGAIFEPANISQTDPTMTEAKQSPQYVHVDTPDAVIGTVMNIQGSIGWASSVGLKDTSLKPGVFVVDEIPDVAHLRRALSEGKLNENASKSSDQSYPAKGASFLMLRNGPAVGSPCHTVAEILRYYQWMNENETATNILQQLSAVPVDRNVFQRFMTEAQAILRCRRDDGKTAMVWDEVLEAIEKEKDPNWVLIILGHAIGPLAGLTLCVVIAKLSYDHVSLEKAVESAQYQIQARDLVLMETSRERYKEMIRMRPYLDDHHQKPIFRTGEYHYSVVMLRPIRVACATAPKDVKKELIYMQNGRCHQNLTRFIGLVEIHQQSYLVSEMSLLGDLRTLLSNKTIKLPAGVSYFMARGVVSGLCYLHAEQIQHGNLRSTSVYVESDWTVKLSDWEYSHLYQLQGTFISREWVLKIMFKASKRDQNVLFTPLLWTAPELLRAALRSQEVTLTYACDSYSFGVILYEILTRHFPYHFNPDSGDSPLSLLMRIMQTQRTFHPLDLENEASLAELPQSMQSLMRACWNQDPLRRVTAFQIADVFAEIQADTKRLADLTVIQTDYTIERQKTQIKDFNVELKQRVHDLRKASEDFLTPRIHQQIRKGEEVVPLYTERAYVLHLTLVDYDDLLEPSQGETVMALLERFHVLIGQFITDLKDPNIFRLHTNGDDCTIIGAIPDGGIEYADKIAVLAMNLIVITWKAVMLDIDTDHIKIKLGIHCGPVVSGLYGTDHTEYTVIGEARDFAEDMERLSATYRILVSEDFISDLQTFEGYSYMENKDPKRQHDRVKSYWLLGRENYEEQSALDEVENEYGKIVNGQIPTETRKKKRKSFGLVKVPSDINPPNKRRASLVAHNAFKAELIQRPVVLQETRSSGSVAKEEIMAATEGSSGSQNEAEGKQKPEPNGSKLMPYTQNGLSKGEFIMSVEDFSDVNVGATQDRASEMINGSSENDMFAKE